MSGAENQRRENGGRFHLSFGWWSKLTVALAPVALLFITLGEATDAAFLLRELSVEVYGYFSNQPEYDVLERLHVGNTKEYAAELAGMPEVSRSLSGGTTATYHMRGDYLLTLFIAEERLTAYTVVILDDRFTPAFDIFTEESRELGSFTYTDIPIDATKYYVDVSAVTRYYVESFDAGRAGGFIQTYFGNLDFGAGAIPVEMASFYDASIGASAAAAARARLALRKTAKPNFYGRGQLQLEQIIESLLTLPEFKAYFPK